MSSRYFAHFIPEAAGLLSRNANDAPTTSESATRNGVFSRSVTDTATVTDSATAEINPATNVIRVTQAQAEVIYLPLSSTRMLRVTQAQAEVLYAPDITPDRTTTESVTVTDAATASVNEEITRNASDSVTTSESVTRSIVITRATTDAPTTSESATRTGVFSRSITQTVTTSETATAEIAGQVTLVGSAAGTATTTGALSLSIALVGSAAGTSTTTGALGIPVALTGSAAGSATATATLESFNPDNWSEQPYTGPVEILYKGIDITRAVMFQQCTFRSVANGAPGTATLRVRDISHELGFTAGRELECWINGVREWDGYIARVRRGYFIVGGDESPAERVRYFELEGVDRNVLLQKRVLYHKTRPTKLQLTTYDPDTPDDEVIVGTITAHSDLLADGISLSGVEEVGTPSQDDEISAAASWTIQDFLAYARFETGAIDYIDPDRVLQHVDVDTPNAPYPISDNPSGSDIGVRDFEINYDGSQLRNDVMVWGAGQGAKVVRFHRETNQASITEHNRWQVGLFLQTVWRQSTVEQIAESYVHGSPQNKRGGKDDAIAIRATTFQQGFRVAQKVDVTSDVFGYSDIVPIRAIDLDFPTPNDPRWVLTISHEIDTPWNTSEFWFPKFDFDIPGFHIPPIPPLDIIMPPLIPPFDPCAPTTAGEGITRYDVLTQSTAHSLTAHPEPEPGEPLEILIKARGHSEGTVTGSSLADFYVTVFSASENTFMDVQLGWNISSSHVWHVATAFSDTNDDFATGAGASVSPSHDPQFFLRMYLSSTEGKAKWWSGALSNEPASWNHTMTANGFESIDLINLWGFFNPQTSNMVIEWAVDFVEINGVRDDFDRVEAETWGVGVFGLWASDVAPDGLSVQIGNTTVGDLMGLDPTCPGDDPDPPLGPYCEEMTQIADPPNRPTEPTYFQASNAWYTHTETVWMDGLLLRRGIDYDALYYFGVIAVDESIDTTGKTIYICYNATNYLL